MMGCIDSITAAGNILKMCFVFCGEIDGLGCPGRKGTGIRKRICGNRGSILQDLQFTVNRCINRLPGLADSLETNSRILKRSNGIQKITAPAVPVFKQGSFEQRAFVRK